MQFDTLDPSYLAALAEVEQAGCPAADPLRMSLQEARAAQDRYFAFLNADPPPVALVQDLEIPGPAGLLRLRLYRPQAQGVLPVVMFVRGAGWWAGGLHSHDRVARSCALDTGCAVLAVDYHSSPEHQYPTQLEEVLAAVRWARAHGPRHGFDPGRLALWGESAGATLSVLAAMRLRDAGEAPPAALVLFYGNFNGPGPTTRAQSKWVWQQYLGEWACDNPPPGAIPARLPVTGLPPTWLGVGDADPLLQDTLALQARLDEAGVVYVLRCFPRLPHAFMNLTRIFEGARVAGREAAGFARERLGLQKAKAACGPLVA